jgi:hypothetical protein
MVSPLIRLYFRCIEEVKYICITKLSPSRDATQEMPLLLLGQSKSYLVKKTHLDSIRKFSETDTIKMVEALINHMLFCFVNVFCNRQSAFLWVPTVLLISSRRPFLYSYETYFMHGLSRPWNVKLQLIVTAWQRRYDALHW